MGKEIGFKECGEQSSWHQYFRILDLGIFKEKNNLPVKRNSIILIKMIIYDQIF